MRNDELMQKYIDEANDVWNDLQDPTIYDPDYELYTYYRGCIHKAAKAGGFFRTEDFIEWAKSEKINLSI